MKNNTKEIVSEEINRKIKVFFMNIIMFTCAVFFICSLLTTIVFGVYLLPRVINDLGLHRFGWIFALGVLGYLLIPELILIHRLLGEHKKDGNI